MRRLFPFLPRQSNRHARAGEDPEGGEEEWMLACASMTVEAEASPSSNLPHQGEGFFFSSSLDATAESIFRSGMDKQVLPAHDD